MMPFPSKTTCIKSNPQSWLFASSLYCCCASINACCDDRETEGLHSDGGEGSQFAHIAVLAILAAGSKDKATPQFSSPPANPNHLDGTSDVARESEAVAVVFQGQRSNSARRSILRKTHELRPMKLRDHTQAARHAVESVATNPELAYFYHLILRMDHEQACLEKQQI
jgi:hypothetical protein